MLEGLDKVDWQSIMTAHGPIEKIPEWLEQLASPEKRARSRALELLIEVAAHQGCDYPVTLFIVPFLIQHLQKDEVRIKAHILTLLYNIGSIEKTGSDNKFSSFFDYHNLEQQIKHDNHWTKTFGEAPMVSYHKTHLAAAEGLEIYLNLIETNPYLKVRIEATYLLRGFPEYAKEFVPRLIPLILKEENPTLKANLLLTLADVAEPDPTYFELLEPLLSQKEKRKVRITAAYAQTCLLKEKTSDRATALLLSAIRKSPDILKGHHYRYPSLGIGEVAPALCNLEESKYPVISEALWEGLNNGKSWHSLSILVPLFYLTFRNPFPSSDINLDELTELQWLILDYVATESHLWNSFHEYKTRRLLNYYNLPSHPEELHQLLNQS